MKKKLIIFDFDGTIADTLPHIINLYNTFGFAYGFRKITKSELECLRGKTISELMREFNASLLRLPFLIGKVQSELYSHMDKVRLFPNMKKVIVSLKKSDVTLGVVSSNSKENIEKFFKKHKIATFDFIHSEKNIFGKDKVLMNIMRKYPIPKGEIVYIGDEVRDIEACRKIGIDCISVTWGFNKKELLKKENPTLIVDTPEELLSLLTN
ncbi:carotenoid oxygenase [Candidatus Roizmanbacteria bacterium CG09_land_8_20_14_0_10_41_9]|uniref:Carotenoid oxygenase n=1 Tax=Candidatus Roizmanbacteria bacterium CG09_land_8_20_14_0_10_41_9 TaxID=1974850 RepID=A0A2H0WTG9_9BACT|nr:MAG: carotenoid oxygenase [Candidatus Roizmanbacteria bacterium CG09_land_8_20_14_0_10_41_9]